MRRRTRAVDGNAVEATRSPPKVEIAVRMLDPTWRRLWPAAVAHSRSAARLALDMELSRRSGDLGKAMEMAVVLSDNADVRRLNRTYRGIDRPTNVLAFGDAGDSGRASQSSVILGDVILARETVMAEAAAQSKTVSDHAVHLVVHGVLHLLGHDHQTGDEAELMEAMEIQVLARLGVADPYIVRSAPPVTRRRA